MPTACLLASPLTRWLRSAIFVMIIFFNLCYLHHNPHHPDHPPHHHKVESIATEGDDLDPLGDGVDPVEDDEVSPPPPEQEEDVEPPQVIMMVVLLMATIVTVRMMMKIFLVTGAIMGLAMMK